MRNLIKRVSNRFGQPSYNKPYSAVFIRHAYYHFYYLAKALRARGWDTLTVNFEPEDGPNSLYYHDEDLNVFSENRSEMLANVDRLYKKIIDNYHLVHFAGDGLLTLYQKFLNYNYPPDLMQLKYLGKGILHTVSGCNSGISQSQLRKWSSLDGAGIVCDSCRWNSEPSICNDEKNLAWGKKMAMHCDLIFSELQPSLDYLTASTQVIREPVSLAMDEDFWSPNIRIPDEHRIERKQGEILVYHAVGNFNLRSTDKKNIKGTAAIDDAIEKLKAEGYPVRLLFVTDKKNTEVRYYQAQADIIVDQLNYGRYGANAREGMMLGKPVICYIQQQEMNPADVHPLLKDIPLFSATENTVYDALKTLIDNPALRQSLSEKGRKYAIEWHGATKCAERYEKLYEQHFLHQPSSLRHAIA